MIPEAVTWFFTSVLKGLQVHGQHDGCMAALVNLAFQIYEALVRSVCEWWEAIHSQICCRLCGVVPTPNPRPISVGGKVLNISVVVNFLFGNSHFSSGKDPCWFFSLLFEASTLCWVENSDGTSSRNPDIFPGAVWFQTTQRNTSEGGRQTAEGPFQTPNCRLHRGKTRCQATEKTISSLKRINRFCFVFFFPLCWL